MPYPNTRLKMAAEPLFRYEEEEISALKRRDKRLAALIEAVGPIERTVIPDLFTALVHAIVGQQISTKAHETVWRRMQEQLGEITPQTILRLTPEALQAFGLSSRKAAYIRSAARKIDSGAFDIEALQQLPDDEVCARLVELDGVGVWTAEMLMIFSMQRRDVLSYGDLGIRRGLRMLYRHREIDRARFARYRKRYSPCASIASLYLWALAGGAVAGVTDPAEPLKNRTKR